MTCEHPGGGLIFHGDGEASWVYCSKCKTEKEIWRKPQIEPSRPAIFGLALLGAFLWFFITTVLMWVLT